jgi:hypothetical protein
MTGFSNPHHTPEILALMTAVEGRFGRRPETSTQFISLSYAIETVTGELLSASTLKRLWSYVSSTPAPRINTLDILSQYVGQRSFRTFCESLRAGREETSGFFQTSFVVAEELEPGTLVEVGWAPDRLVRVEFLGEQRFKVVEARNSKLRPGDEFETASMMTGYPLCLSGVLRDGKMTTPFVGGKQGGLTIVRIV